MEKIITNLANTESSNIMECADAFRSQTYDITSCEPSPKIVPHNLSKTLQEKANYKIILDDPEADFRYFSITYISTSGQTVLIPVGVYGISNKKEALFPLAVYGIWFRLLTLNRATFLKELGIDETEENELYFSKFIDWKKEFMTKIFSFYLNSSTYCSAMSWKIKGEKSNTRVIAESLGYHRTVFNDSEVYTKYKLEDKPGLLKYFKNCLFRWDAIGRDEAQSSVISENIIRLLSNIVGLKESQEIPS